jgi:SAM-dependent methyltransferase
VLHHVPRPELVLAEMTRATRPDGRLLVIDQLAPIDPLVAIDLDRFERTRDPSHTRLLSDGDLRAVFEMNGLVLIRSRVDTHDRELEPYLDLAGCEGEARGHARSLAPGDSYRVETGWYLLRR